MSTFPCASILLRICPRPCSQGVSSLSVPFSVSDICLSLCLCRCVCLHLPCPSPFPCPRLNHAGDLSPWGFFPCEHIHRENEREREREIYFSEKYRNILAYIRACPSLLAIRRRGLVPNLAQLTDVLPTIRQYRQTLYPVLRSSSPASHLNLI